MRGEAQACGVCVPTGCPDPGLGAVGSGWVGRGKKAFWRGWARAWVRHCVWCPRTCPEDQAGRMEDLLEELLQHREPEALQQCLRKVRPQGRVLTTGDRPC